MKIRINQTELELVQGDITDSETDAIVNAANSQLILGAGVAGAIREKGGPTIQEECGRIGHCPVGDAVITSAGQLKTKFVIHAVGPRWGEGNEEKKLRNATWNSLQRAEENKLGSITFPAISTGIFGFPLELAAQTMLKAVRDYCSRQTGIQTVVFALFDDESFEAFQTVLQSPDFN